MIELIGWIAIALIGAYACFVITCHVYQAAFPGGLESIPLMLISAWAAAVVWMTVVVWLSPLSLSLSVQ